MTPLRFRNLRWTTLLLAASVALTTVGVIESSRAVRSQRVVAEHALRDYAGFAAWSYQQHLRLQLALATEELLGAVNHGHDVHRNPRIPPASDLAHYIRMNMECGCHQTRFGPSPMAFLAFKLGTDTLGVALNAHPDSSEGWEVDVPLPASRMAIARRWYSAAQRAQINDTLTRQIRAKTDVGRFPLLVAAIDSVPRILTYTLMPTVWGDTLVYAAEYDRRTFVTMLGLVMNDQDLLPATFMKGKSVRQLLELQVTDARGNTLFQSNPVHHWALDDTAAIGAQYGGMRVRAQIRAEQADGLVIGGLPRSRLPFLLALLAVAAALSFVAVGQIRREGELSRLRGDFVASISHELRTPLAQMRLYLDTLRLGRFTTDAQREWSLDNVERETTRLTHLVERVLRFSRADHARPGGRTAHARDDDRGLVDARQTMDVAAELRRIVAEFEPLADARGAKLVADIRAVGDVALEVDALRHIALNLLDNAVKYGPRGQTVRIRLSDADREVRLEVADEGAGIPSAERERIWQPYQRGETAGHAAGSGIGLSIVRDVTAQHGGRAWVADTPAGERGARIVVTLPIADVAKSASRTEAAADIPLTIAEPAHRVPVRG